MAILVKVIAALSTGRSPVTEAKINKRDSFATDGINFALSTTSGLFFQKENICACWFLLPLTS